MGQAGGRIDWRRGRDELVVQGDLYASRIGQSVSLASFDPPEQILHHEPADLSGGNVMATWRRAFADTGVLQVRAYFDRTDVSGPQIGETRNTTDLDVTYSLRPISRHNVLVGGGARISPSRVTQTVPTLDVSPHDDTAAIYAGFVRDTIALVPDRLEVTLGAKFEHYTYTGAEVQPSARVLWTPRDHHSVWAGVTRAVRTPSRLERAFTLYGFLAPEPPTYIRVNGNAETTSERLLGVGAGYRGVVGTTLYVDVAAFSNRHDDLQSFGSPSVLVENGRLIFALPYANGVAGRSRGIEVAPQWRPASWWQIKGYYAYLRLDLHNQPGSSDDNSVATYEGSSPRHQASLQSLFTLPHGWEFDQTVRSVSALPARNVERYTTADVRLSRWFSDRFQLSVVGQNLFDAAHLEFGHDPPPPVSIRRSVVVGGTWTR